MKKGGKENSPHPVHRLDKPGEKPRKLDIDQTLSELANACREAKIPMFENEEKSEEPDESSEGTGGDPGGCAISSPADNIFTTAEVGG